MYDSQCDDCKHEREHVHLAVNPQFKKLLKAAEKAFKTLHQKGKYHPKDLATTKAYQDLIFETNGVLGRAFKDNDLSPEMLNSLENDVFYFSGLKTHAQLFEASRQLLTEDKTIKSFAQFSKDVSSIKKNYNENYLEAEYDFAVGSVQMAERYELFSDSDRYYLQYRTADDDRVRVSHQALHDITLPKTDAFWDRYFPPNGWRCRCTTVEVLASLNDQSDSKDAVKKGEAATTQIGKNGKNKLEIFRFNAGRQKVVFPPGHPYNKVAGNKKAKKALELVKPSDDRYRNITFKKVPGIKNKGVLEIFDKGNQNKVEFTKNKKALTIASNTGRQYRMLPVIEDGNRNPDAFNIKSKAIVDVKVTESKNGKNIIQNALKEASKQGASEIVIHLTVKPESYREMYGALLHTIDKGRNKNINTLTIVYPNESVKVYEIDRKKKRINR